MPEPRITAWEETLLERIAPATAYPATPDFVPSLRHRLAARPSAQAAANPAVRRLALGLAALLLAFVATLAVSREARDAVADFLGLGVAGERIEQLPTPAPGVTPTPFPTPPRLDDIARRITAEQASARLGFAVAVPSGQGEPASIYTLNAPADTVVILRYPGFDLWEFATDQGIFLKKQYGGSPITETTVNGATAYWIGSGTRLLSFVDASGNEVAGTQRTTTESALLWSRNGRYFRIEGVADLESAKRIAESVQ